MSTAEKPTEPGDESPGISPEHQAMEDADNAAQDDADAYKQVMEDDKTARMWRLTYGRYLTEASHLLTILLSARGYPQPHATINELIARDENDVTESIDRAIMALMESVVFVAEMRE